MGEPISELFMKCVDLAMLHVPSMKDRFWEHKLDDVWSIEMNGKTEAFKGVPPFGLAVLHRGMPAAILNPRSGMTFGGFTEDEMIEVVDAALSRSVHDQKGTE